MGIGCFWLPVFISNVAACFIAPRFACHVEPAVSKSLLLECFAARQPLIRTSLSSANVAASFNQSPDGRLASLASYNLQAPVP
jgi:hypothetical protein